jgi:peptidoglycan/LPS O-acetylase OafA/YrhL|tara:strand:- start:2199 stop:2621 length:423 start_codon:yes stop_codon:yes gene_type:complete
LLEERVDWPIISIRTLALQFAANFTSTLKKLTMGPGLISTLSLALLSLPLIIYLTLIMWPFLFLIVLEESDWISVFKPAKALVGLVAWSDLDIYLGKMSYSAYLQHIPLFSSVVGAAGLMLGGKMSQLLPLLWLSSRPWQ